MAILEVKNIEKHFGATRVLKDVSFWKKGVRLQSSVPPALGKPPFCVA